LHAGERQLNGADFGKGNLMDDEDIRVGATQTASQVALEKEPIDGDWGFCAYGDAPAAIGGGMNAFFWFETRRGMLAFIAQHALFINPPRADLDLDALEQAVGTVVAAMQANNLDDSAAVVELNKCLRHASQFTWIGQFRSLRSGETDFARQILAEFREEDDTTTPDPVTEEELEDFRQFLLDYCTS
jgi:hypothetical protein